MRGESARWRGALGAIATFGTLPAATSGCLAPTDITLEVTSDLPCSKLEGIAITAGLQGTVESQRAPSAVTKTCTADGHGGSFGTLVLTPSGGPDNEIAVRVVAGVSPTPSSSCNEENAYNGCIVVRRVLHYDAHTPLTLPIEVHDACLGVTCVGEDTTCVEGVCRSARIDDPSRCVGDGCSEAKLFADEATPSCLGDLDFVGLGTLPGTNDSSFGALSADGRALFAFSSTISGGLPDSDDAHAFRCASPDERSPVVGPNEHPFVPTATDASGSVVAGFDVPSEAHITAVRWTAGKAIELRTTQESVTTVRGCDRNACAVLVGTIDHGPVLWRSPSDAPIELRGPDGSVLSGAAAGVDPTGRFAFGTVGGMPGVWNLSTNTWRGIVPVDGSAKVLAATPNGSRLAGYSGDFMTELYPLLWTSVDPWSSYTLKKLRPPPGVKAQGLATAVSDDGEIVTGTCGVGTSVATLWEASSGFAPVRVSERVDAPPGWELMTAWVSADGKTVAGDALNPHHHFEPYIALLK